MIAYHFPIYVSSGWRYDDLSCVDSLLLETILQPFKEDCWDTITSIIENAILNLYVNWNLYNKSNRTPEIILKLFVSTWVYEYMSLLDFHRDWTLVLQKLKNNICIWLLILPRKLGLKVQPENTNRCFSNQSQKLNFLGF